MSIQTARAELALLLASDNWNTYDVLVESIDPPCIVIGLPVLDYSVAYGKLIKVSLNVTLHYSLADLAIAQTELISQITPGTVGGALTILTANRSGTNYRSLICAASGPFYKAGPSDGLQTLAVDLPLELLVNTD